MTLGKEYLVEARADNQLPDAVALLQQRLWIPCVRFRVLVSGFGLLVLARISGFGFQVSGLGFPDAVALVRQRLWIDPLDSNFGYLFRVSGFWLRISGFQMVSPFSSSDFGSPGFWFGVWSWRFRISGHGFRASGLWFRVSGLEF